MCNFYKKSVSTAFNCQVIAQSETDTILDELTNLFQCIARLVADSDAKEVASDPPNIRTGPGKRGRGDSILFGKPTYASIGDPFKEAALCIVRKEHRAREIEVGNEKPFKLTKAVRQPDNSAYPHMKDFEHVQKNFRDVENNNEVMIGPRNLLTNPPKAGIVGKNTTFGGMVPYIEDDYNRPKMMETEKRLAG